jgi:hypothetical protein
MNEIFCIPCIWACTVFQTQHVFYLHSLVWTVFFSFFFLAALVFELRASVLLGRCSSTAATPSAQHSSTWIDYMSVQWFTKPPLHGRDDPRVPESITMITNSKAKVELNIPSLLKHPYFWSFLIRASILSRYFCPIYSSFEVSFMPILPMDCQQPDKPFHSHKNHWISIPVSYYSHYSGMLPPGNTVQQSVLFIHLFIQQIWTACPLCAKAMLDPENYSHFIKLAWLIFQNTGSYTEINNLKLYFDRHKNVSWSRI